MVGPQLKLQMKQQVNVDVNNITKYINGTTRWGYIKGPYTHISVSLTVGLTRTHIE